MFTEKILVTFADLMYGECRVSVTLSKFMLKTRYLNFFHDNLGSILRHRVSQSKGSNRGGQISLNKRLARGFIALETGWGEGTKSMYLAMKEILGKCLEAIFDRSQYQFLIWENWVVRYTRFLS